MTDENKMTDEDIENEYVNSKWRLFNSVYMAEEKELIKEMTLLYKTDDMIIAYDIRNRKNHNNWRIEYMKYQIKKINIYKSFIHLKLKESLLSIALNGADENIKRIEKDINDLERFDYDVYSNTIKQKTTSSSIAHHFIYC